MPDESSPPFRSITLDRVGAREPTISANNLQSQKPARPGYYGQSIGHNLICEQCQVRSDDSEKSVGVGVWQITYQFQKIIMIFCANLRDVFCKLKCGL